MSDYKDGLHVQCVAAFFFMYFACLTPIVTFGGLLGAATDNYIVSLTVFLSHSISHAGGHKEAVGLVIGINVKIR